MTPDRWLHPNVEAAVEAEAVAMEEHRRRGRWLARWGPLLFIGVALVAMGVVVTVGVIAIQNLDDAVQDAEEAAERAEAASEEVSQAVREERCRDNHRDEFFVNIVKNIQGRPGAPSLQDSINALERVSEDCDISRED